MILPSFGVRVIPGSRCKACQNLRKALFPHDTSLGNPYPGLLDYGRVCQAPNSTSAQSVRTCRERLGSWGVRVGILGIGT